jgi:hypothetical protein
MFTGDVFNFAPIQLIKPNKAPGVLHRLGALWQSNFEDQNLAIQVESRRVLVRLLAKVDVTCQSH